MTKSDLINIISEKTKMQHRQAEIIVNMVFDIMSESLKVGDRIEIRGFGSFVNREYGAYKGRNPKTGETVQVDPKKVPFFKVGKELKELVDLYNFPRPGVELKPLAEDTDDDND